MNNNKVLYFEGSGSDYTHENSNVGNYRIRTAFTNNEGKMIYLELGGHEFEDKKKVKTWKTHIDHVFYITGDNEDCNKEQINFDWQYVRDNVKYTNESIIQYVNILCNTNFESMEVLDRFEDYRVHVDNNTYNLMNNHIINRKRTEARKKAYTEIDNHYRNILNSKYSKISLMSMDDISITVRCHDSKENLERSGLSEEDREKTIIVMY